MARPPQGRQAQPEESASWYEGAARAQLQRKSGGIDRARCTKGGPVQTRCYSMLLTQTVSRPLIARVSQLQCGVRMLGVRPLATATVTLGR